MGRDLLRMCLLTYGGANFPRKAAMVFLLLWGAPSIADPATDLATNPVRLLAFGDSLTQGYGLPVAQGFVPQMGQWLEKNGGDVEIVNAGVSGDTTAGGAARIEWTLAENFDAMIVTLGGNDLLRGIDPANSRANIRAILTAAKAKDINILLVGMKAPGNYGGEYKAAFDAIYPELATEFGALYFDSFFRGLGEGGPATLQEFMQSDAIHPNADGVIRIVDALGPSVLELIEMPVE